MASLGVIAMMFWLTVVLFIQGDYLMILMLWVGTCLVWRWVG